MKFRSVRERTPLRLRPNRPLAWSLHKSRTAPGTHGTEKLRSWPMLGSSGTPGSSQAESDVQSEPPRGETLSGAPFAHGDARGRR